MRLTIDNINRILGGTWIKRPDEGILHREINQISIDSRTVCEGDVFFALKGQYFDGNDYAYDALQKGALCSIVSKPIPPGEDRGGIIRVDDTLASLQSLASEWRQLHNCPIIAITGSTGKTTTKEMLTSILSEKYRCFCTKGNMNNHIGVPLTIMKLRGFHEVGVLEFGMNQKGEIAMLTSMVKPEIGVITNIGKAHIGFLDSINGVLEAKAELLEGMGSNSRAVLDRDGPFFDILASKCRNGIITIGTSEESDLVIGRVILIPDEVKTEVSFKVRGESYTLSVPILGKFIARNLAMSVVVALELGCGRMEIESGISKFTQMPGRMYHHIVGGVHIIDDSYNANPESVHHALKTLIECKGTGKSLAILGDMLELGNQAECLHRQLGQWLGYKKKVDYIITFGPNAHVMAQEAIKSGYPPKMIWSLEDQEKVSQLADSLLHSKDWVLIKGSRGMGLESVSKRLTELISSRNGNKRGVNSTKKV